MHERTMKLQSDRNAALNERKPSHKCTPTDGKPIVVSPSVERILQDVRKRRAELMRMLADH